MTPEKRDMRMLLQHVIEHQPIHTIAKNQTMSRQYASNRVRRLAKRISLETEQLGDTRIAAAYNLTPNQLAAIIVYHHRPNLKLKGGDK